MKAVVVHQHASVIERAWAPQYAGLDADVKRQFATVADWTVRVQQVFLIPALTWTDIVQTVSRAAQAAGQGGVVILASGHGGSINPDVGIINWDPTEPPGVKREWTPHDVGRGLFWEETVSRYTEVISKQSIIPTRKAEDEDKIKNQGPNWQIAQKRHKAFEALQDIGNALQANKVRRLTFTVCSAGSSTNFMDRLAKHCQAQVACFRPLTKVIDDAQFGSTPGKARLVFANDSATDGQGTNTPRARVFSPDLDDNRIAYVAKFP
jgi:hypothetical protein